MRKARPYPCNNCQCCNIVPNYVPYGEGYVKEGDYRECAKGYDAEVGDCPPEEIVPYDMLNGMVVRPVLWGDAR